MMKKLFVVSTVAMFMFSSMAFAGGGKGFGRNGKVNSGSTGKGTVFQSQTRKQIRDVSGKAISVTGRTGIKTQDRLQDRTQDKLQDRLQDGSGK